MADPDITVRVALDSDPDDPAPVWTSLNDRLHYGEGGREIVVEIGRQDERAEIQPTEQAWAVRNNDNRFTPRNPGSDLYEKWEQGRRCQVRETVDGDTFDLGTGFLTIPDMPIVDPNSQQAVTVTAVDWIGRLESAAPFEGTLAEHIRTEGGELAEWFPFTDPYPHMSTLSDATVRRVVNGFDLSVVAEPADLIRAQDADGPPGDDQRYARWDVVSDGTAPLARAYLLAPVSIPVGATDTVAISVWVQSRPDPDGWVPNSILVTLRAPADDVFIWIEDDQLTGVGVDSSIASVPGGQVSGSRKIELDEWRLVTGRVNCATGAVDLWCGTDMVASGTITAPGAHTVTEMGIGLGWIGAIGHVQVRVGDTSTMTYTDHVAQHRHGYRGLERQTVAERLVTLGGYAGIPSTELDVSAAASTPLQVARLAGANPADAFRATARAGQDTLITSGDGKITVVPRSQRYNQAVALEIPFGWIGYRGLRYRPDPPVTDVVVTRTGGGVARRIDRIKRSRYGVRGLTVDLDSAIDSDPGNLAGWLLAALSQMRTRCPSIVIRMLRRSFAERKALLGLKVGDRIEITDLPDGSPEDVPHLLVQGIRHTIGPGRRRLIQFNTSPLLGPEPGVPPPCPMVGDLVSADAIIAY
ncbi:hypothetical protein [Phytohabitans aurantiacus]|uniref:Tail protein n=1 Tax=Phytohabitans aurantiacus TaxID=3016789 RepID=A0ABQ5QSZ6_9ACTN|nr:hypothetical protein [Phytohabitans aurantiacus]GLH97339.1 hypothetical protein Pa4123_26140 [Phytohabitans aurantiacus]